MSLRVTEFYFLIIITYPISNMCYKILKVSCYFHCFQTIQWIPFGLNTQTTNEASSVKLYGTVTNLWYLFSKSWNLSNLRDNNNMIEALINN